MQNNLITAAEKMGMFCRLQMHVKKDLPIRSSEMGVLIYVQKQNEAITPLMISNFFKVAKPSVTATINELTKKDYLIKNPSTSDKRSYTVSVTKKGKALVESTHDEYFRVISVLQEKMGEKAFAAFIAQIELANNILSEEREE